MKLINKLICKTGINYKFELKSSININHSCKCHKKPCECKKKHCKCLKKLCECAKKHCICPDKPTHNHCEKFSLINCVPFSGSSNTVPNTIFNIEDNCIPVLLAGSIENFSNAEIIVIFCRTSGQVETTVLANSSISFVYDDIKAVNILGSGQAYTGSFKYQATYKIED